MVLRRLPSIVCFLLTLSSWCLDQERLWSASAFGIQQQQQRRRTTTATGTTATAGKYNHLQPRRTLTSPATTSRGGSSSSDDSGDFSSFAASLEEEEENENDDSNPVTAAASASSPSPSVGNKKKINGNKPRQRAPAQEAEEQRKKPTAATTTAAWQNDLEELLDPQTRLGRRQELLQKLLSANEDIRASVQKALADRNIDPLLTPRAKKIQAGTRAVARQISSDILPSLAAARAESRTGGGGAAAGVGVPPIIPPFNDLSKVGGRVFSALQSQFQKDLKTLQSDLADPTRIPQRISQQTEELVKEAWNVFAETPVGLQEPKYTVVRTTDDYEIRDYEGYKVASTSMAVDSDDRKGVYTVGNVAQTGAAFNSLAAYLFGANRDSKVMDMTTPVTTTMGGEMRFYLSDEDDIPEPLEQDESKSVYETGNILIEDIPPARLAVRRFTGFVTEGEITRQKEALLTALELDGVELDVPHGQTVGYVVFQYNPPYTIPVVRRNEVAVPVVGESSEVEEQLTKRSLNEPWDVSAQQRTA